MIPELSIRKRDSAAAQKFSRTFSVGILENHKQGGYLLHAWIPTECPDSLWRMALCVNNYGIEDCALRSAQPQKDKVTNSWEMRE